MTNEPRKPRSFQAWVKALCRHKCYAPSDGKELGTITLTGRIDIRGVTLEFQDACALRDWLNKVVNKVVGRSEGRAMTDSVNDTITALVTSAFEAKIRELENKVASAKYAAECKDRQILKAQNRLANLQSRYDDLVAALRTVKADVDKYDYLLSPYDEEIDE